MEKSFRFVCENFRGFQFAKYVIGKLYLLARWGYSQFQDRSCGLRAIN